MGYFCKGCVRFTIIFKFSLSLFPYYHLFVYIFSARLWFRFSLHTFSGIWFSFSDTLGQAFKNLAPLYVTFSIVRTLPSEVFHLLGLWADVNGLNILLFGCEEN